MSFFLFQPNVEQVNPVVELKDLLAAGNAVKTNTRGWYSFLIQLSIQT
jgi:hypothetical protein